MTVQYSTKALARGGLLGGGRAVQFVTKADPDEALVVFRAAAREVEAPIQDAAQDGEDTVATSSFAAVPGGPIAFMNLCDNIDLLETWLSGVAARLEAAGLSGRMSIVRSVEAPEFDAPAMVAVFALHLEYDEHMSQPWSWHNPVDGWWVSQERTQRVLPALVEWCLDLPGETWVYAEAGIILPDEAVTRLVLSAVHTSFRVMVHCVSADGRRHRRLSCHGEGDVVCSIRDEDLGWADHASTLEPLLRHAAPDVDHAFLRPGPPVVNGTMAWETLPRAPYVEQRPGQRMSGRMWPVAHLLPDHVPDAYVQQVLTTSHLSKTVLADPATHERWRVEHLGHDRHLVTARDPGPWLDMDLAPYGRGDGWPQRRPAPDPTTLDQARRDFGTALITGELLEQHPAPDG